jgi:predicted MFS family arabinose efflux permease
MATASIVGPPLAAPLLFTVGMQWALVLNAASYVVSFIAIRSIRLEEHKAAFGDGPSFRKEFVEGLRFFKTNRFIVTLLTVAVIVQSGTGAWETLDVFFVTGNLHSPARLFGFISMAMGIGSIVGALWSSRVVKRLGARGTLWGMLLVSGFLILAYSLQTDFPAAFVLVVAIAIPIAMVNTSISPLFLQVVPKELLGRTMAVFNPINQLSSMLSTVAAGWLMSTVMLGFHADVGGLHLGPIDTIFSAVALLFIFAAGYGFLRLPRLEKSSPASEAGDSGAQTPTGSSFSRPPR